ncbi:MAG: arylesterase [Cyclobacteriaceae bacterium]|nr:MAG: arylesterase [Cyclobacteriaceae bacterium]
MQLINAYFITMNRKALTWVVVTAVTLALILAIYTYYRLHTLGAFTKVLRHHEASCRISAPVTGAEAIQLDKESGILYFIGNNTCFPQKAGGIYHMDLTEDFPKHHPFKFSTPKDFHPHGLSYFRGKQGEKFLLTNNHRKDGTHSVEVFQITANRVLKHLKTLTSPQLTSPNDLVAISPDQFYLTNDGRAHNRKTRAIDTFLNRRTGSVLYYDGVRFKKVLDNLKFPNGIAFDSLEKRLFIGETLSGYVKGYQVLENNDLQFQSEISVAVGIDNLSWAGPGRLLVAVHPDLYSLSKHIKNSTFASPSRLFQLDADQGEKEIIFESSGDNTPGVSSAVRYKQQLILGTVCSQLFVCEGAGY